ncbi:NAD(P)-dependent dehydrogenase (short-subunit alcohol dehydrogenase family) [Cytobacillus kochii]|nr:NAD(P)-dependent dehydrogenase (short-subunit alcohol dehydrogenase family) [Cytobacillus kochii]
MAPGFVDTPFHEKFVPKDDRLKRMSATTSIKMAAKPMEVAVCVSPRI